MNTDFLLVISVLMIGGILIPINYESMYNYATYTVPIKNIKFLKETSHTDPVKIDNHTNHPIPLKKFEYLEKDNSLTVTFGGGKSFSNYYEDIPDFSYTKNFQVNQTFVFRCIEEKDYTFLGFYKYLGTTTIHGDGYLLLWHIEGETQKPVPCNYPDIIINSIDVVDIEPRENYLAEVNRQFGYSNP